MATVGTKPAHTDMYTLHCKGEFKYLRDGMDALNKKVFNGLSDLPQEVQYIKHLLIGLLVSMILLAGGVTISTVLG